MKATEKKLNEVFASGHHYAIPNFQRPYSWGIKETTQLLDDLQTAWKSKDSDYFLGSLVVVQEHKDASADVIDGQQRLTTLMLLLSVARDFIHGEREQRELYNKMQIPESLIEGKAGGPRLVVREQDREFFEQYIVAGDLMGLRDLSADDLNSISQQNFQRNTEAIISSLGEEIDSGQLWDFILYVLNSVHLVIVTTTDLQTAHKIFGVLNTRGLPLNAADIFKARILGSIPTDQRDEYARRWDTALSPIEEEPDKFFQHLFTAITRSPARQSLASAFTQTILDPRLNGENGAEVLETLVFPYAEAYHYLSSAPGSNHTPSEALFIELLQTYRSEDWMPLAMWARVNTLQRADFTEVLGYLEHLMGITTVADMQADKRRRILRTALERLTEEPHLTPEHIANAFTVDDDVRYATIMKLNSPLAKGQRRQLVLQRAHFFETGEISLGARRVSTASVVAGKIRQGIAPDVDRTYWEPRLGSLVLVGGSASTIENAPSWSEVGERLRLRSSTRQSKATTPPLHFSELTTYVLAQRHEELVRLIARAWGIDRNSSNIDLTRLSNAQIGALAGTQEKTSTTRVTLQQVVEAGLIEPGTEFVWYRPVKKDSFTIRVTPEGNLELPSGEIVTSPSAAVTRLTGGSGQALDVWKTIDGGQPLRDFWDLYRSNFLR